VKLISRALDENSLPFINGGKHLAWAPEISTSVSLVVIAAAMAIAVLASLIKLRIDRATA
jgi:tellurite resistance protein TerC